MLFLLGLSLLLPLVLGGGPGITGKYTFQANDHADFQGNSYVLFACDDTGGNSGKVHISVWAMDDVDEDGDDDLSFVQAMGGTEFGGNLGGGDKVKGRVIMLWGADVFRRSFRFWYTGKNFRFDLDGVANKAKLTKSCFFFFLSLFFRTSK